MQWALKGREGEKDRRGEDKRGKRERGGGREAEIEARRERGK